eukprot:10963258-Karenia_brevis.AAC.1
MAITMRTAHHHILVRRGCTVQLTMGIFYTSAAYVQWVCRYFEQHTSDGFFDNCAPQCTQPESLHTVEQSVQIFLQTS